MKLYCAIAVIVLGTAGCRGESVEAAAPSGVQDGSESASGEAVGRFDCLPDEEGEGWDCRETG